MQYVVNKSYFFFKRFCEKTFYRGDHWKKHQQSHINKELKVRLSTVQYSLRLRWFGSIHFLPPCLPTNLLLLCYFKQLPSISQNPLLNIKLLLMWICPFQLSQAFQELIQWHLFHANIMRSSRNSCAHDHSDLLRHHSKMRWYRPGPI